MSCEKDRMLKVKRKTNQGEKSRQVREGEYSKVKMNILKVKMTIIETLKLKANHDQAADPSPSKP